MQPAVLFKGHRDAEARHVKVEALVLLPSDAHQLFRASRVIIYSCKVVITSGIDFLHGQANTKLSVFTVSPFLPSRSAKVAPLLLSRPHDLHMVTSHAGSQASELEQHSAQLIILYS